MTTKQTLKQTKKRRKTQDCKVYQIKVDKLKDQLKRQKLSNSL